MAPKKIYWDTSCFISYLSGIHPEELARSLICEDVLKHARNEEIEIWTSVYTIVETIRPKAIYQPEPVPLWADLLNTKDSKGNIIHPEASSEFDKIWNYYKRNTLPTRLLSEDQALKIKQMFDWSWIRKIQVIPVIAHRAAEIARSHNMKAADSLHVASALHKNCDVIYRWDRDYSRTDTLIPSQDPVRLTPQNLLDFPS
jgi:predicted nucleic acid-binding protein